MPETATTFSYFLIRQTEIYDSHAILIEKCSMAHLAAGHLKPLLYKTSLNATLGALYS